MLVKLSGIIAEARGSVGGLTAARNRYGAYFRNRTKPVDPGSAKQNTQRTQMSASVVAWRALTAAQRDLWNAKSLIMDFVNRIGESFHPSGMNLFIRGHQLLLTCGRVGVTSPPVTPVLDDKASNVTYTVDPGFEINTTIADWQLDSNLLVWQHYNLTNSTFYYKGPYPNVHILGNGNFPTGTFTMVADADLDVDSSMFAAWRYVQNDGSASAIRRGRAFKPPA